MTASVFVADAGLRASEVRAMECFGNDVLRLIFRECIGDNVISLRSVRVVGIIPCVCRIWRFCVKSALPWSGMAVDFSETCMGWVGLCEWVALQLCHGGCFELINYLDLGGMSAVSDLVGLRSLTNLHSLKLDDCKNITSATMSCVSSIAGLRCLSLLGLQTGLGPALSIDALTHVARLKNLWCLKLDACSRDLNNAGLRALAPLGETLTSLVRVPLTMSPVCEHTLDFEHAWPSTHSQNRRTLPARRRCFLEAGGGGTAGLMETRCA